VLPEELRAVMKSVTKYTNNTGGSAASSAVTATTDYTFLMAEFEIFGAKTNANQYEQSKQAQYDYFKAGNPKVFYRHSATTTAVIAWLRSPYAGNSNIFCAVNTSGAANTGYASCSLGVAPGFCA